MDLQIVDQRDSETKTTIETTQVPVFSNNHTIF